MCIVSYAMTSLSENSVISLIGYGLCGVTVAAMWSLASEKIKGANTAMFAFFALVGYVSAALGDDLKKGIYFL